MPVQLHRKMVRENLLRVNKVSARTKQHKYLFRRISFVSTDHLQKLEIKYISKEEDRE